MKQFRAFQRETPWQSGAHRFWFLFCAACLSLYLSYVLFLSQSTIFTTGLATALSLLWFLLFAAAIFLGLLWGCRRLARRPCAPLPVKQKLDARLFLIALAIPLLLWGCGLLRCYPGGMSHDADVQWTQVQTSQYSNWHPVFHTLLMWLGTRLFNSYPFLVAEQIGLMGLALAYLVTTLHAWGCKRWQLLAAEALLAAIPLVGSTVMHIWKDNAMTFGVVLLLTQTVNLYLSHGKWLQKPRNAVAFGLTLAFTTLVRHNAFLFTVPLMVIVLACERAYFKRALLSLGVLAGCVALVMGPVYSWVGVTYPDNTFEESIGVPMTILGDVRVKKPDALSPEARAYLDAMATEEEWQTRYQPGNYNSIKFDNWEQRRLRVIAVDKADFWRMAADAVRADPRDAFEAVNSLTDLVWGVQGNEAYVSSYSTSKVGAYEYAHNGLNELGKSLMQFVDVPMSFAPLQWYGRNIGVSLALMLLVAVLALYRSGPRALLLCLPMLLYDLGTMCLLCGNDARFFQCSLVLSTFAMFVLPRSAARESEKE